MSYEVLLNYSKTRLKSRDVYVDPTDAPSALIHGAVRQLSLLPGFRDNSPAEEDVAKDTLLKQHYLATHRITGLSPLVASFRYFDEEPNHLRATLLLADPGSLERRKDPVFMNHGHVASEFQRFEASATFQPVQPEIGYGYGLLHQQIGTLVLVGFNANASPAHMIALREAAGEYNPNQMWLLQGLGRELPQTSYVDPLR